MAQYELYLSNYDSHYNHPTQEITSSIKLGHIYQITNIQISKIYQLTSYTTQSYNRSTQYTSNSRKRQQNRSSHKRSRKQQPHKQVRSKGGLSIEDNRQLTKYEDEKRLKRNRQEMTNT